MSQVQNMKPASHAVIGKTFTRSTLVPVFYTTSPTTNELVFDELDWKKPFIVVNDSFKTVIGSDPKLTLLASNEVCHGGDGKPFAHEAGVYFEQTGDVYFTSNLLEKTYNLISKINPVEALKRIQGATKEEYSKTLTSNWTNIKPTPEAVTGNGATRYKDGFLLCSQGNGDVASALVQIDVLDSALTPPSRPILNNFFGRRFNSVNDVVILPGPTEKDPLPTTDRVDLHSNERTTIWFTDPIYGFSQGYNPPPSIVPQVYCFCPSTGDIRVVADGFIQPNGLCFNYEGTKCYVTDTGHITGNGEFHWNRPSTIYEYDVIRPGPESDPYEIQPTLVNRRVFSYPDSGVPDGIKCDRRGNVYSGCGDGIHVWNKNGLLIGKIVLFPDEKPSQLTPQQASESLYNVHDSKLQSRWCANFNFIPDGKIVIFAEDRIYLAELNPETQGALL